MNNLQEKRSLKITKELNSLGNLLTHQVTELLIEVDSYNDSFYENTYIAPSLQYFENNGLINREIKKGETIFDRVNETVKRNEMVIKYKQLVQETLSSFVKKMEEMTYEI